MLLNRVTETIQVTEDKNIFLQGRTLERPETWYEQQVRLLTATKHHHVVSIGRHFQSTHTNILNLSQKPNYQLLILSTALGDGRS
jgi:hypothetical protein